jgi:hypothetical protein
MVIRKCKHNAYYRKHQVVVQNQQKVAWNGGVFDETL